MDGRYFAFDIQQILLDNQQKRDIIMPLSIICNAKTMYQNIMYNSKKMLHFHLIC